MYVRGRGWRESESYKSLHISVERNTSHSGSPDITPSNDLIPFYENWITQIQIWIYLLLTAGLRGVMDPIVEVVALLLGFIGWVMVGVAMPNRYWKTSTVDGNVITTSTIYENLWMSCATDSTGVHNCREFPSLLALSGRLTHQWEKIYTTL